MLKQLFCKHDFELVRTIHGEEIIGKGFKRSIWTCTKCKKTKYSEYLNKPGK